MSEPDPPSVDISRREKLLSFVVVFRFEPLLAGATICLSLLAAILEGFGLSFILPIVEVTQSGGGSGETPSGILEAFLTLYATLGIPFTLGYLVAGVIAVMAVRFTASFLAGWFRVALETRYVRHLQDTSFDHALEAEVSYFDREGSDDILNAIVTQAEYAGRVVRYTLQLVQQGLLILMYVAITLAIAPVLTLLTAGLFGVTSFLFRHVLDAGYDLGDEVADAKERIQRNAQAGTQGIRDVKLYGLADELASRFDDSIRQFERARIKLQRNSEAIVNFHQLTTAVTVFGLVYVSLTFLSLSFGELGVFLFAMFRLGPKVSSLNGLVYLVSGELPHLVRTQRFVETLRTHREQNESTEPVPNPVTEVAFEDVSFVYETGDERVLRDVSFALERGEFIAIVGPSGAGKSTIASLIARMYEPDSGRITADGTRIDAFDLDEWRSRVAVVRQNPDIFNDTLRRNVTIGNRNPPERAFEAACEIARVTEFVDDLPDGYDTLLGDRGVRLSGGQRQRVAIARALLKDADVLVLDEATSDLDTSLESEVHRGIESMERDYAIMVIAHRLSTVTNADRIHAMERGEIVETGNHDELVEREGLYAQLYAKQS